MLLVDPEAEYSPLEASKLRADVIHHGLSVIVLADWYNAAVAKSLRFYDDNTHAWWTPITGGANVPALNGSLPGPHTVHCPHHAHLPSVHR